MPSLSSSYTSRFAASGLLAERSHVNSSTAAVMASGGSAGFNRSHAVRWTSASTPRIVSWLRQRDCNVTVPSLISPISATGADGGWGDGNIAGVLTRRGSNVATTWAGLSALWER